MITKKDIRTYRETHRVLLRERDFIYILPHPALRAQVSNYTLTFPNREIISNRYTVIPHGSATLVFSLDTRGVCAKLFGPITRPCMVGSLANQYEMLLIIEFQPAGLSGLTGAGQRELTDRVLPLEGVHATLNRLIVEALERACDLNELVERLDGCLLAQLRAALPGELQLATELMVNRGGSLSSKELSALVYYSPRHLNRIFDRYLGMNTKTFSRLVRINKAIRLLQNPQCSITRAAHETEYYDLSHFIHEFQAICDMTPQAYRNNVSDFYSEIAKF